MILENYRKKNRPLRKGGYKGMGRKKREVIKEYI